MRTKRAHWRLSAINLSGETPVKVITPRANSPEIYIHATFQYVRTAISEPSDPLALHSVWPLHKYRQEGSRGRPLSKKRQQ